MAKFCPYCGSQVREGSAFCSKCGNRLADETPALEAVPAPAVPAPAAEAPAYTPAAPVSEPAPAGVPVVEPAPAIEPAAPVAAVVTAAPVAAPVTAPATPVAAQQPAPEPISFQPMPFEAPSGPISTAPVQTETGKPEKKNKIGLIVVLASLGVVLVALIVVGIVVLLNGGIGGTIIERIERKDAVETGKKYTIYDEDFNDYVVTAKWWDYDDTMDKPGTYSVDTETIAFSIEVNEDAEDEIYYAYYYSKDKEFDKDDLSKPIYSDSITPVEYSDGRAFYDVDCSKVKKGYYVVVVASDDSLKYPYVLAYAEVK
ncbi:zinc ribbon domain-containing protein [Butyrivibrio sp. AE2032]|uniref:zinc ribbon domain-containing protein n=2 Tax=Butyrivibrio sp. AE2032 TaxID=1458463 RepID=UPI000558C008|nr:zinc ribbon domain-containing protein [Butyrivibrio sp. AE2032]